MSSAQESALLRLFAVLVEIVETGASELVEALEGSGGELIAA